MIDYLQDMIDHSMWYRKTDAWTPDGRYHKYAEEVESVCDLRLAHLISSQRLLDTKQHLPLIDLDVPAALVPSSTPGHFHLYINKSMTLEKYITLLTAMADAGIVEPGYVESVKIRGAGHLRKPGVKKGEESLT